MRKPRKEKLALYYQNNKEQWVLRRKKQVEKNPKIEKRDQVKKLYGISLEEYEQRFEAQKGLCGICQKEMKLGKQSHLDHNHKTGKIRGFLCTQCNSGLGFFKDDFLILEDALEYLENYK